MTWRCGSQYRRSIGGWWSHESNLCQQIRTSHFKKLVLFLSCTDCHKLRTYENIFGSINKPKVQTVYKCIHSSAHFLKVMFGLLQSWKTNYKISLLYPTVWLHSPLNSCSSVAGLINSLFYPLRVCASQIRQTHCGSCYKLIKTINDNILTGINSQSLLLSSEQVQRFSLNVKVQVYRYIGNLECEILK